MTDLYNTGIRPIIDDFIQSESEKKRDYGDYWSASSAGYCHRKVMFDRLGIPPVQADARKQRIFSSGDIFHQWIQQITKAAGLSIAQELELQDEDLMIRGHIDDLVLVKTCECGKPAVWACEAQIGGMECGRPVCQVSHQCHYHAGEKELQLGESAHPKLLKIRQILYDYKTAHSKWFEYAKNRPMSYYHRHQLGTYMYMLRRRDYGLEDQRVRVISSKYELSEVRGINLTEARRLTISKDDLRLHEQQLLWSPELEADILSYWEGLNEAWDVYNKTGVLPPCTCAKYEINSKTGIGFMADPKWNPYYYQGEPCSEVYFRQVLKEKETVSG